MQRRVGTTVRGLRAPMVKEGDNIVDITVNSVVEAAESEGIELQDRDVVGITESLVARAQGNYVTVDQIAEDLNKKFKGDDIAVLYPILSRNRFAIILRAIERTGKRVHLFLNYPSDEVGNHLTNVEEMDRLGIDPYKDFLTEDKYRELFEEKYILHPFTGVDYVKMYKDLSEAGNIKIYLSNNPLDAMEYADDILVANIHERFRTKRKLKSAGAKNVYSLDEMVNDPNNGDGYNEEYGLLGSNAATDEKVKLFPRDCDNLVKDIQDKLEEKTGKIIEVLVYGDGAFKDPVGKIWELADPVVSPGFTDGLLGTPNEIKLKYVADNEFKDLSSKEMMHELKKKIRANKDIKSGQNHSLGTTPRQLTDLIGSLCDLTSGSGDKGTPIILVQGYFDSLAVE